MGKLIDNRYEIIRIIGEGGMGTVYLAQDLRLRRQVAVKRLIFQGRPANEEMFRKRFEREALAMAGFQHPNIVSVFDFGQDDEGVYLVLEYMPGASLSDRMRRERFTLDQSIRLVLPLADALQEIHGMGQVHRDIKPSNILFDKYGNPKLADFGVVKLLEGEQGLTLTTPGAAIGTPAYMAPELIVGDASAATDQYALGVVLYELVTGKKPFQGRTPVETLTMQKTDPLPDPRSFEPELPDWICEVLKVALGKESYQRYPSVQDFAEALRTGEQGQPASGKAREFEEAATQAVHRVPPQRQPEHKRTPTPTPQPLPPPIIQYEAKPAVSDARQPTPQPMRRPSERRKKFPVWIALAIVGFLGIAAIIVVALVWGMFGDMLFTPATQVADDGEDVFLPATETPTIEDTATPTVTPSPTITPTPTLGVGSTMLREQDGMSMVFVPAGTFEMGSNDGNPEEQPVHEVYLDAFWIDTYEVTNAQFTDFVFSAGYITDAEEKGSSWLFYEDGWEEVQGTDWRHPYGPATSNEDIPDHPVVHVSWNDAVAYCQWVGAQLPTEAQWEKAARGTDGWLYPWGNLAPSCGLANYSECVLDTSPIGSYPDAASPYGVLDMSGNVWEWVADWYDAGYYSVSPGENPTGPTEGEFRTLRGGSHSYDELYLRTAARISYTQSNSWFSTGFRCVMPAEGQ